MLQLFVVACLFLLLSILTLIIGGARVISHGGYT
jgi:hypothetical protein